MNGKTQPSKWRDTIDPFSLKFNKFRLTQVLGYPHAGNDVFYVSGIIGGKETKAFLKVERQEKRTALSKNGDEKPGWTIPTGQMCKCLLRYVKICIEE